MIGNSWSVQNLGIKYKKNPIYEMQDIKMIKIENIPEGLRADRYAELVDSDFVGKLVIVYDKDNIGQSGGSAKWCYVYDCNHGKIKYNGTAIHKCVDIDHDNQNYNEKLYSVLGNIVFDSNTVRIPKIDLVKNLEYPEDMPAVLSYNIVQRENGQDIEEMLMMETVAFNKMERQDIRDHRIPLSILLESVKIQVMKKVGYEKKKAKEKIEDKIVDLKIAKKLEPEKSETYNDEQELLTIIKDSIDEINKDTTLDSFLKELSTKSDRKISEKEIKSINLKDTNLEQVLSGIKKISAEKTQNYEELKKSIIQATTFDLMTNNVDRHLNNWSLIRNKKTDNYVLGLFDHAASFLNMAFDMDNPFISRDFCGENWQPSSVLLDNPNDIKNSQSKGKDVLKYLMENHREDTLEILQKLYDRLPQIEKAIGYETIPNDEFLKLSKEQAKNYCKDISMMKVKPKKIMDELKSKFRRIKKDYDIDFKEQKEKI